MRQAGTLETPTDAVTEIELPERLGRILYGAIDASFIDTPQSGLLDPYTKGRVYIEGPFNLDLAAKLFWEAIHAPIDLAAGK